MKRALIASLFALWFGALAQNTTVLFSSNGVVRGDTRLRWQWDIANPDFTVGPLGLASRINIGGGSVPSIRLYAGGNPAASYSRLEGFWDSANARYVFRENVSGSNSIPFVVGINSGATLTFNTDGSSLFSGGLGLSGTTNRLTMVNNTLYLDGQPAIPTAAAPVNNFYATNIFVQNGSHNTMIVSNSLTIVTIKTNVLGTTATGLVTNINYGSGITWTPSTLTLSASGSGDTTGTNIVTLTQTGTNISQMDFALLQFGGAFKLSLTNNGYVGAPANVATSPFRKAWLLVQQPSTGTCILQFTNGFFAWPEGVAPVVDTNNGSVAVFEFVTDVFSNIVHGSLVPLSKLATNM